MTKIKKVYKEINFLLIIDANIKVHHIRFIKI